MIRRRAYSIALLAALLATSGLGAAPRSTTTIILVRHAERLSDDADSPLSNLGEARAAALRDATRNVPLAAIYVTPLIRTRSTAQPAVAAHRIEPVILPADTPPERLAERILRDHHGRAVLVVGHSNTIPEIVRALGAGPIPAIEHDDYDDLYIVMARSDGGAHLVHLHYGARHEDGGSR